MPVGKFTKVQVIGTSANSPSMVGKKDGGKNNNKKNEESNKNKTKQKRMKKAIKTKDQNGELRIARVGVFCSVKTPANNEKLSRSTSDACTGKAI